MQELLFHVCEEDSVCYGVSNTFFVVFGCNAVLSCINRSTTLPFRQGKYPQSALWRLHVLFHQLEHGITPESARPVLLYDDDQMYA